MKLMIVSDIHGRHETLRNAFDQFLSKGLDRIILLGDLADSYMRSNEDILQCYTIAIDMKGLMPEKVVLLLGNHELHYMFDEGRYLCSGFRPDLRATLHTLLNTERDLFQVAHKVGNYLFTHAGVQKKWLNKYEDRIKEFCNRHKVIYSMDNLADILNMMFETAERDILAEVGTLRGGLRYDYGGPFWCDRTEMMSYGPIPGFHQVVGHTPQQYVNRQEKFEGDKHYNNTSVTFIDVYKDELPATSFFTLEINTK